MPVIVASTPPPTTPDLSGCAVTFKGITVQGSFHDDDRWVTGITGWESTPGTRWGGRSRPTSHGAFRGRVLADERRVVVTGTARSAARRDALLAEMQAAWALSPDGLDVDDLTIDLAGRTLTAGAQLTRFEPVVDDTWAVGRFPWAVEWICPDPYRYGPAQVVSTGLALETGGLEFPLFTDGSMDVGFLDFGEFTSTGRVALSNPGTAQARPMFTVTGDLADGFELVETYTGSRLRYEGPVTSQGDAVTLDSATGRVRLGTADRGGLLTRNDWWGVPAGEAREVLFRSNGAYSTTAQLTVSTRPTYW